MEVDWFVSAAPVVPMTATGAIAYISTSTVRIRGMAMTMLPTIGAKEKFVCSSEKVECNS
jgi:hypothetical protein